MGKYVDSKTLELNWFYWQIANSVSSLEQFRQTGSLYTKIHQIDNYNDPNYPIRHHYVVLNQNNYYFYSINGLVKDNYILTQDDQFININNFNLKYIDNYNNNYIRERPVLQSWDLLTSDINKICIGIANKLRINESIQDDAINDVFLTIISKLQRNKLKYKPGKAPVFNLLTTAIHNCFYSWLSKNKRIINNKNKLTNDLLSGSIIPIYRSLAITQ